MKCVYCVCWNEYFSVERFPRWSLCTNINCSRGRLWHLVSSFILPSLLWKRHYLMQLKASSFSIWRNTRWANFSRYKIRYPPSPPHSMGLLRARSVRRVKLIVGPDCRRRKSSELGSGEGGDSINSDREATLRLWTYPWEVKWLWLLWMLSYRSWEALFNLQRIFPGTSVSKPMYLIQHWQQPKLIVLSDFLSPSFKIKASFYIKPPHKHNTNTTSALHA